MELKQRINKQFQVYASAANIFNWSDSKKRNVTGYPSSVELYGSSFNIGLKYDIFK